MKKKNRVLSFFKVLVGDFSTKLDVPPDFIKNFNGDLPKISSLKSPTKKSWGVLMEKTEEGFFFSTGWSKFVTDHNLQYGDFLLFRLITKSTFRVSIYGHNACEKDTSFVRKRSAAASSSTLSPRSVIKKANHKKKKIEHKKEPKTSDASILLLNSLIEEANKQKRKIEPETSADDDSIKPRNNLSFAKEMSNGDNVISSSASTLLPNPLIEKANHKEKKIEVKEESKTEPDDDSIKPANDLHFVKEISNANMKYTAWLPVDFARATGLVSKKSVILKDITEGGAGEEWLVEVRKQGHGRDRVRLASGWNKFVAANGLDLGDLCSFEFVHDCLHVKVSRKRAAAGKK